MRPSQNPPLPEYTTLFNKCICATLPESPPSQNIPLFNNYVRPSENLPLPPIIYPSLFNNYNIMRPFQNRPLPPRIYPSIFNNYNIMRPSQNLPIPPRIYPPLFNKCICVTLPESTPPSQNTPPFSATICDPPRIYPSLPESPPFNKCICATLPESTPPSQDTPPFSTTICDPPRIYPSISEYTPLFNKYIYVRPSQSYENSVFTF